MYCLFLDNQTNPMSPLVRWRCDFHGWICGDSQHSNHVTWEELEFLGSWEVQLEDVSSWWNKKWLGGLCDIFKSVGMWFDSQKWFATFNMNFCSPESILFPLMSCLGKTRDLLNWQRGKGVVTQDSFFANIRGIFFLNQIHFFLAQTQQNLCFFFGLCQGILIFSNRFCGCHVVSGKLHRDHPQMVVQDRGSVPNPEHSDFSELP